MRFQTLAEFEKHQINLPESTRLLFETLENYVIIVKTSDRNSTASAYNFIESLKIFRNAKDEITSSVVLYEANNLIDSLGDHPLSERIKNTILEALKDSDVPKEAKGFKNNPDLRAITHAHKNINNIISFLDEFLSGKGMKGDINYFNTLLNKKSKDQAISSRVKNAKTRDQFSRAINALEHEEVVPKDYDELLKSLADKFEQQSREKRRHVDSVASAFKSLVHVLDLPIIAQKMIRFTEIQGKIGKIRKYADAFSSIANEMKDLGDLVIKLKNTGKSKNPQKVWDKARELIKRSYRNISKMGGKDREINASEMIEGLRTVAKSLDEAREQLNPSYRNAKNRNSSVSHSSIDSEPDELHDEPEKSVMPKKDVPIPPKEPEKDPTHSDPVESDAPPGYYTTEDMMELLGLTDESQIPSLVKFGFIDPGKYSSDVKTIRGAKFYKKSKIDDAKTILNPKGKPLDKKPKPEEIHPEEDKPGSKEDLSPADPDRIPKPEDAKETGPVPPKEAPKPPPVPEPEEYEEYSATAADAFHKPIHSEHLKSIIKSSLYSLVNPNLDFYYEDWAKGTIPFSYNPWLFYLALRGYGDRTVEGTALNNRIKDIFQISTQMSTYNPWSLLQAYDRLKKYVHELESGPSSEDVSLMIANHAPEDIIKIAKSKDTIQNTFWKGPQLAGKIDVVKAWLNKIPKQYEYARQQAGSNFASMLPPHAAEKFLYKL